MTRSLIIENVLVEVAAILIRQIKRNVAVCVCVHIDGVYPGIAPRSQNSLMPYNSLFGLTV